jgi:hypothetical protein
VKWVQIFGITPEKNKLDNKGGGKWKTQMKQKKPVVVIEAGWLNLSMLENFCFLKSGLQKWDIRLKVSHFRSVALIKVIE